MAEAVATVGLVASIVQLVEFGSKVVHRLHEFQSNIDNVPKVFRDITNRLPLLIETLEQTKQADSAHMSERTAKALEVVIDGCRSQMELLDKMLNKHIPKEGDSSWRKSLKALSSLAHDKGVQDINTALRDHVQTLTYYISTTSNQVLRTAFQQMKLGSDPPPRKPVFMAKFDHDEDFIGREDIMKEIGERQTKGQHRVAIAGIGGVGKSRIAIEYCYRYRATQPKAHIFWVHASSHARFEEAYKDIARELAIPGHDDPSLNYLDLVVRYLSDDANGPWLLVIDNADDSEVFFPPGPQIDQQPKTALINYLPKSSNGLLVITTRDTRVGEKLANRVKPIPVLPLNIVDAQRLLKSKSRLDDEEDNEKDALELLEALTYLPLAITQAAAFISENDITVKDYVEMLQASDSDIKDLLEEDLHDAGRDIEIQNSVFQTWYLTFRHLSKQKPRAAELLSLMALFHRSSIPAELLRDDNERKVDFVTAVGTLKAFSLICEEKSQSVYGIHRLVQLSIQRWLEIQKELLSWQEKALTVVAKCCPSSGDYETWSSWQNISAHAQAVLGYNLETCLRERAEILNEFGTYDKGQGRYEDANEKVTEALALRKNVLGENHADTLMSMLTLSVIYERQGRLVEAEEMCSSVVQTTKRMFGQEHPHTLNALNDLGVIYVDLGRDADAEQLYRYIIETDKRVLGPEKFATLQSIHNLAVSIQRQGRLVEAEAMLSQLIKLRKNVLGLKHPETLKSMDILAETLYLQNRREEAAKLHLQLIDLKTEVLTVEHPDTLSSLHILGIIFQNQGLLKAAEELHLQVVKTRERILGQEHPETLLSSNDLAVTYIKQGRWEEAESLHANVLEIQKRVLGLDHGGTLAIMHNLAVTYKGLNRDEDALNLMMTVAAGRTKTLGAEHRFTQWATKCIEEWTRMRDDSVQKEPDPGVNIRMDSSAPLAADISKSPTHSLQGQLSEQPGHAPESSDPQSSSDDRRKETIPASQGESPEQTVNGSEDPDTLISASHTAMEKPVPAHEVNPPEHDSAPVS